MGREGGRCQRRGRQRATSGGRRLEQSGTERGAVSVGLWFGRKFVRGRFTKSSVRHSLRAGGSISK
jgi:hypothetical protein